MALGYATNVPVGAKKDIWSARTWARWAKMDQNRLKMGLIHLFVPKPSWTLVGHSFEPFWIHFLHQNGPFLRSFGSFDGRKGVNPGSKPAHCTGL